MKTQIKIRVSKKKQKKEFSVYENLSPIIVKRKQCMDDHV
jgi:hypothetical protein